jgi:glyoxylase-like metal-dependent hydrolase (beta-lactamase superfamily II)
VSQSMKLVERISPAPTPLHRRPSLRQGHAAD